MNAVGSVCALVSIVRGLDFTAFWSLVSKNMDRLNRACEICHAYGAQRNTLSLSIKLRMGFCSYLLNATCWFARKRWCWRLDLSARDPLSLLAI